MIGEVYNISWRDQDAILRETAPGLLYLCTGTTGATQSWPDGEVRARSSDAKISSRDTRLLCNAGVRDGIHSRLPQASPYARSILVVNSPRIVHSTAVECEIDEVGLIVREWVTVLVRIYNRHTSIHQENITHG